MSFEQLTVLNLKPGGVCKNIPPQSIIIHTCQRTIVAGFTNHLIYDSNQEIYFGTSAYKFLLEVICGLKSRIIAEYEIVAQFKNAYHQYLNLETHKKNGNLIKIIEKLFKDSKEIRTKYLLGISHESYAGITKKILKSKLETHEQPKLITILGSGKLAEDLIKNCSKSYKIKIIARNQKRLKDLMSIYDVEIQELGLAKDIVQHSCIINTIGAQETLFDDENFFNEWKALHPERFFLDLGSPSTVETFSGLEDTVILLSNFFKYAEIIGQEKKQKIELASIAIEALVKKRDLIFNKNWNINSLKNNYQFSMS